MIATTMPRETPTKKNRWYRGERRTVTLALTLALVLALVLPDSDSDSDSEDDDSLIPLFSQAQAEMTPQVSSLALR
jgi:hypothetical protein